MYRLIYLDIVGNKSSIIDGPSLGVNPMYLALLFKEETVFAMELVLSEAKAK
jgi:hypothetical protein